MLKLKLTQSVQYTKLSPRMMNTKVCYLAKSAPRDNHSATDRKLGCINLRASYPQAICSKTPITQSFKVSNWGPSVWICYCQLWFKDEDNTLHCSLLLTLQGICDVKRMDAQPFGSASFEWTSVPRGDNPYFVALAYYNASSILYFYFLFFLHLTTGPLPCDVRARPTRGGVE